MNHGFYGMAGWFEEQARPAILRAVEAACNRLDADLATGM
jgi:hypothetical protein